MRIDPLEIRMRPRNRAFWPAIVCLGLAGAAGSLCTAALMRWLPTRSSIDSGFREITPRTAPDAEEREAIDLFKTANSSLVNVDTVQLRRGLDQQIQAAQTETGSGFLWDDDGRIVTNYHVVQDAYQRPNQLLLRVVLADRSEHRGAILGVAPEHDLAVIQIHAPASKFRKIAVGRSNDLEVGQRVYAIGNPFGLSLTLTKGIVSALDREIESPARRPIAGVIQTDAPINPGNSGGPLLDKDGRLIGVNTAIRSPSGGSVGIGFAIPVDTVASVVGELIRNGRVLQPDLGLRLVDLRKLRRAGFVSGVMIETVEPNSPAAAAGLRGLTTDPQTGDVVPGDLLLKFNGVELTGNGAYENALARLKPGERVKVLVERTQKPFEVELVVRGI